MREPPRDDLHERYRKAARMSAAVVQVLEELRTDLVVAVDQPRTDEEAAWAMDVAEKLAEAVMGLLPVAEGENGAL